MHIDVFERPRQKFIIPDKSGTNHEILEETYSDISMYSR